MIKYFLFCLIALASAQGAMARLETIPSGRPDRADAKVYLPKSYGARTDWPVILLLHGYEENQSFISRYFFGSDEKILDGNEYILVVPEGLADSSKNHYHFWNASGACCDFGGTHVDDVKYLTDLIDQVSTKYHVDKSRVYATGHSNGAFMAHRLACSSASRFAAIAAFAGMTSLNPDDCKPDSPVSLLQINALDDDTIKYGGSEGFPPLASYPSADLSAIRWASFDHCNLIATPGPNVRLTDNLRFGGIDASSKSWSGCISGVDVIQYQIQPYSGFLYHAHTPLLSWNFTTEVVRFLLSHRKVLAGASSK